MTEPTLNNSQVKIIEVLRARFMEHFRDSSVREEMYGLEIAEAAHISRGFVYVALAGLENKDIVKSRFEDKDQLLKTESRRMPRRLYSLKSRSGIENEAEKEKSPVDHSDIVPDNI